MERLLEGKVALVTGGTAGIGAAAAMVFAREGASVVIADIIDDGGRMERALKEKGAEALFVKTDVAKADQVEMLVETTVQRFGKLDCAFNNAGIEGDQCMIADCMEENWDRVVGINLKGIWLCMKYELRKMLPKRTGAIVNNSSVAGQVGFTNISPYVASKHGVLGLTKSAALECAQLGVRVNAVCPGVIRTPMIDRVTKGDPATEAAYAAMEPVGRMGTPDEVAEAVVWLCSDRSSFVTGHALTVDGALTVR